MPLKLNGSSKVAELREPQARKTEFFESDLLVKNVRLKQESSFYYYERLMLRRACFFEILTSTGPVLYGTGPYGLGH